MMSQMSELVKAQAVMAQSVGMLGGQVSNLMSEVSKIKSGGGMGGGGTVCPFQPEDVQQLWRNRPHCCELPGKDEEEGRER